MNRPSTRVFSSLILTSFAALALQSACAGVTLDLARQKKIDRLFGEYDKPTRPGCALGVMSDGRLIYTRGYGMASLDPPLSIDSTKLVSSYRICIHRSPEQWIYKHWAASSYCFIPLESLSWQAVTCSTDQVLDRVFMVGEEATTPDHDYKVFHRAVGGLHPTARLWQHGTWNILLLIMARQGIRTHTRAMSDVRYILIEGHQRMRYLNALKWRGDRTGPHHPFVLSISAQGGDTAGDAKFQSPF